MSKYKMLGALGSILIIIGTFFTFAKVEVFGMSASASLIQGFKGIIILIIGIINLIIFMYDEIKNKIPFVEKLAILKNNKLIMIISAIVFAIVLITAISTKSGESAEYTTLSLGFYATFIGSILCIISAKKVEI